MKYQGYDYMGIANADVVEKREYTKIPQNKSQHLRSVDTDGIPELIDTKGLSGIYPAVHSGTAIAMAEAVMIFVVI